MSRHYKFHIPETGFAVNNTLDKGTRYSYDAYGRRRNPLVCTDYCLNQNFQDLQICRIF
jgi:hypothetical protein